MASAAAAVVLKPGDKYCGIIIPTLATLAKYGWDVHRFVLTVRTQQGRCACCGNIPSTGRLCIDHFHAKGWKTMPPEQRRLYCRGLVDWWCNSRFLSRGITLERSEKVTAYLRRFEAVRPE